MTDVAAEMAREFPDYPVGDLPTLPEGFVWQLWGAEPCPCARDDARGLTIYADYADAEKREFPDSEGRFSLHQDDGGEEGGAVLLLHTDDWPAIIAATAGGAL